MASLRLENIDKIYDNGFHAVHGFNLDIKEGEFIVFVGPSGCGKSTTLRMIAGLEKISKGNLYIDGQLVNEMSAKQRGISMVFQSYALYPHMTVFQNIGFGLELDGYDEEVIEKRVKSTAEVLGLSQYLDRFPRELSGGQRQRVAVGRSIVRKPKVFLMDEPLSNLDAKQRVFMRAEIKSIHRRTKATTVYVTHDQVEAMTMADRIVVMRNGYIMQTGTPGELYFNPANKFVAGFLGEPSMNFFPVTAEDGSLAMDFADLSAPLKSFTSREETGKELIMGFRPEAASLQRSPGALEFKGTVELTELLGDSCNVYIKIGGCRCIIKCDPLDEPKPDAELTFYVPQKSVYLFDGETQETLSDKRAEEA